MGFCFITQEEALREQEESLGAGTRTDAGGYGKGQRVMLLGTKVALSAWQSVGALQEEGQHGRGMLHLKMQCYGLGCVNRRQAQQSGHSHWAGLHWKPKCGLQQGPQRRARRKAETEKETPRVGEGAGTRSCTHPAQAHASLCAQLALVATKSPRGGLLSQAGCVGVVCAPHQT